MNAMRDAVNREAYANAVARLESGGQYVVNEDPPAGSSRKRVTMTESYLLTEMPLNQNKTSYRFGILQNDITNGSAGLYPNEKRLTLQDTFFAYRVGFYVTMNRTSAGNTTYQYQWMTFPNPQFYLSGGLDLNLMQGLWNNGEIQLTINGNVITPGWSLKKHLYVPETQLNTVAWPDGPFYNQNRANDEGMCYIEPNWVFNGGNNIEMMVNYKIPLTGMGIGDTAQLRLLIYIEGFLAQNTSSIMDAK